MFPFLGMSQIVLFEQIADMWGKDQNYLSQVYKYTQKLFIAFLLQI